jgi:hypothetical protein
MEPVENRKRNDLPRSRFAFLVHGTLRNPLFNALMPTGLVEELNVLFDHPIQMFLSQDQHVIKALPPYAPQEPFADRVGFGCAVRRFQDFNVAVPCHSHESGAVFAIPISNQAAWPLIKRSSLTQLLRHPDIGWVSRDVEVNDSP